MPFSCTFWVTGEPGTKGSYVAMMVRGKAIAIPASRPKAKAWERAVKLVACRYQHPMGPIDCPVSVAIRFVMRRPKKPRFEVPATSPDIDKMMRCTLDALTGVIYVDDGRVAMVQASKSYVEDGMTGAEITVVEVP